MTYYLEAIEQYFAVDAVSGVLNKFASTCLPSANEFLSLQVNIIDSVDILRDRC